MRVRGAEAEAKWRDLICEQSESGKTVAAFCRERGMAASKLYSWKRRFRESAAAGFVEVAVKPTAEIAAVRPARSSAIEVRLGRGRSLLVEPGFDAHHLRALLSVLEAEA